MAQRDLDRQTPPDRLFLHSWWRSSSTYFWAKLRAHPDVTAYYEPFHEVFATKKKKRELAALIDNSEVSPHLFHSSIGSGGYFEEYRTFLDTSQKYPLMEHAVSLDRFFVDPSEEGVRLRAWIDRLIAAAAHDTVAFGFVRSMGRIAWLKSNYGGAHVLLWRDPWDQWVSIGRLAGVFGNTYFPAVSLMVASRLRGHPQFGSMLPAEIPRLTAPTWQAQFKQAQALAPVLGPRAMLEGYIAAVLASLAGNGEAVDLMIDVREAARTAKSRDKASKSLSRLYGRAIDLSDMSYQDHSRQGESFFETALARVIRRMSEPTRKALRDGVDHCLSRSPTPSPSLDLIRHQC